ncbi:MAG TPA: TIGR03435 family protein [Bryobacteraceae bacterium]|nr:TIGR03435 family protein [Bryobacteraceae bacterium]
MANRRTERPIRIRILAAATASIAIALPALAQLPVAFDAASIKPAALWKSGGEGSKRSKIEYTAKSLSMSTVDLSDCVQWAWDVPSYRVAGPDFPGGERYDFLARTQESVPVTQLRLMLQNLLDTRFHLVLHRTTKMLPVYKLVAAKGGPKLPARKAEGDLPPDHPAESLPRVQDGSFIFQNVSMTDFAAKLSLLRGIELPVVDQTHIEASTTSR